MAELKKCPFCGSDKLKIDSKSGQIHYYQKNGMKPWQHVVFSVRCNKCNARGGAVGADLPTNILGEFAAKKAEVEQKASEAWNNRVNESKIITAMSKAMKEYYPSCKGAYRDFGVFFHAVMAKVAEQLKEE